MENADGSAPSDHQCPLTAMTEDQCHDTGQKNENASKNEGAREKHKQKFGKQSFASLFKDNRAPVESSLLNFIAPPAGEVVIGVDEIDSVEKTFGYCLVGYVIGPRPRPFAVLNFVKRWGGNVKFSFKDNGWIKFQFPNELDRDSVLNGGPYLISGRQLFLKKMPSCFLFSKEDMVLLPSWVQIFGLPADCWTVPALSRIASVVGKPIHTDQLTITKRGSTYARVLVEIDAKKPRVWDVPIKLPTGKTTVINFKYELDPKFCNTCNSLGHVSEMCGVEARRKNNAQHLKQPVNKNDHATESSKMHGDTIFKDSNTRSTDVPECSSTEVQLAPAEAVYAQMATVTAEVNRNHGKAIASNPPPYEEQHHDDFGDDDLLSCDGTDHPLLHEEDFELDSAAMDDLLSRVRTQDREEWKTVSKKNRRLKHKVWNAPNYPQADSGASSMETEYVKLDPISKLPLKGEQSRVFKKIANEARRPDTASGDQ